jgi:carboxypeptidase C (cathepsin A)
MRKSLSLLSLVLFSACALSAIPARAADKATTQTNPEANSPLDHTGHSTGTVTVNGQKIAYDAVAGTITVGGTRQIDDNLSGDNGAPLPGSENPPKNAADAPPTAKIFYVAYFKQGANPETRPITFLYNGGPGSSSVWLHMGAFGPVRVVTNTDQHLPAAPYKLINNSDSLLDATDLVFIDAPGTGFSRIYGKDAAKHFWGVDQDANAFARFIVRFVSKYHRWNSPKYLFGESYGTTRSAVLSQILQNDDNMDLNGVILLSEVLNFGDGIDQPQLDPGNDRPYWLALPTYAATAWYHKQLPKYPHLQPLLQQVEAFAQGTYQHDLSLGSELPAAQKQADAEKLQQFTSIPASYWLRADLRVTGLEFEKRLLQNSDETTGRLDTRFSGPTIDPMSENAQYDPQSTAISSAYVSLFNSYVRKDLHFGTGLTYLPGINFDGHNWDMKHNQPFNYGSKYSGLSTNVMTDLAVAMKTNPNLKVMLNGGYYDLATPFFAAMYEEHHLDIPQKLEKNISYHFYKSGHMVYVNPVTLKQLHDNVAAFIKSTDQGQM